MQVRCLNCQHPIEVVDDRDFGRMTCPECSASFSLSEGWTAEIDATHAEPPANGHADPPPAEEWTLDDDGTAHDLDPTERDPSLQVGANGGGPSGGSPRVVPGDDPDATVAAQPARGRAPLPNLGRFVRLKKLGSGSYGTVWMARDPELDRVVAVKVPRHEQIDPEDAEPFFREARAAAQLRHPNIVAVHEVGRADDRLFIVYDYIEGTTLDARMKDRAVPPREAAALCAKIADALHHAHEAGVIHRDLKPANVMLDGRGEPHIMDFGLARREHGEVSQTVDGSIMGTPSYMSPEQAQGRGHSADRRSDVYSLGVILFRMLTAELPFRGNISMLLAQIINDEPPNPRKLNNLVPRDLETVCLKCLSKSPDRRYVSAAALAADLRRWLDGEPIEARPVGRAERLWSWCKRKPMLTSAVATAAIFFVTTFVAIAVGYAQVREKLRDARLSEAKALRHTTDAGRSWAAIAALDGAAAIRPGPDLRDEYLQALDLPDIRPVREVIVAEKRAYNNYAFSAFRGGGRAVLTLTETGAAAEYEAGTGRRLRVFDRMGAFRNPAALSRDGRLFAALRDDEKGTEVWDLDAQSLVGVLKGAGGRPIIARCLAFSPAGDRLAVGERVSGSTRLPVGEFESGGSILSVYDPRTARLVETGPPLAARVHGLRFGPESLTLAASLIGPGAEPTAPREHRVVVFGPLGEPPLFTGRIGSQTSDGSFRHYPGRVDFSADGRLLVAAGANGVVKAWDITSVSAGRGDGAREVLSLPAQGAELGAVALSPDGRKLLTACDDGALKLWDVETGGLLAQALSYPAGPAMSPAHLEWTTSGSPVLCDTKRGFALWEPRATTSRIAAGCTRADGPVDALAFGPTGRWFAFVTKNGLAAVVDLRRPGDPCRRVELGTGVPAMAFSPPEDRIRAIVFDTIATWEPGRPGRATAVASPALRHLAIAITPSGETVVVSKREITETDKPPELEVWDPDAPGKIRGIPLAVPFDEKHGPNGTTRRFPAIYPDQVRLGTDGAALVLLQESRDQGKSQLLQVFEVRTGGILLTKAFPQFAPPALALAARGRLAAVGRENDILLLDTRRGSTLPLTGHKSVVTDIAFDGTGRLLASVSAGDGTARLWDTTTGDLLTTLLVGGNQKMLTRVALGPSGNWLATGDSTGLVRLWDLAAARGRLRAVGLDWNPPP